jgi:hypothetical protein
MWKLRNQDFPTMLSKNIPTGDSQKFGKHMVCKKLFRKSPFGASQKLRKKM